MKRILFKSVWKKLVKVSQFLYPFHNITGFACDIFQGSVSFKYMMIIKTIPLLLKSMLIEFRNYKLIVTFFHMPMIFGTNLIYGSYINWNHTFVCYQIEETVKEYNEPELSWSAQGMLRISPRLMAQLFQPTIDNIIKVGYILLTCDRCD